MRDDLEDRLGRFEGQLGELRGHLTALEAQIARTLDRAPAPAADQHSGIKTAITFAAMVVVPIIVSLLGGYFALRAAGLR